MTTAIRFSEAQIEALAKHLGECGTGSDTTRVLSAQGLDDDSGQSTKWRRLYCRDSGCLQSAGDQAHRAMALADLDDAVKPADVNLPGYRLHPLKGNQKGFWSITVSANWGIIVRFEDGDTHDVDLVDTKP